MSDPVNANANEMLLKFYLGCLDDEERLEVEESLFNSKEKLADFIALKRSFEMDDLPSEPSRAFQFRLRKLAELKFVREKRSLLQIWIPIGAFALVLIIAFSIFKFKSGPKDPSSGAGVYFDSSGEAAASLSIL